MKLSKVQIKELTENHLIATKEDLLAYEYLYNELGKPALERLPKAFAENVTSSIFAHHKSFTLGIRSYIISFFVAVFVITFFCICLTFLKLQIILDAIFEAKWWLGLGIIIVLCDFWLEDKNGQYRSMKLRTM